MSGSDPVIGPDDARRRLVYLVERLALDFEGALGLAEIIAAVAEARDAADLVSVPLGEDRLALVERLARQRLDLLSGRTADTARLDPALHRPAGPHPGAEQRPPPG